MLNETLKKLEANSYFHHTVSDYPFYLLNCRLISFYLLGHVSSTYFGHLMEAVPSFVVTS